MKKTLLCLLLFTLTGALKLNASHLQGGEVTWTCIKSGPNIGKFQFQVKLYRDCNGILPATPITLSTNAPGYSGGIICNQVSVTDLSPTGVGCPTCAAPGGQPNAVQEYVLQSAAITISGVPPATGWYFYYSDCCRNGAITNLGSGSGNFTLRALMYPYNATNTNPCFDNSPSFAERPQLATMVRNQTTYTHNAIDLELDSLVYDWGHPLDNGYPGINYPFATGYSYTSPLPSPTQNASNVAASLDPHTGIVSFTSFTTGVFVTCTKVTAYKCGIKVAEIYREIQIALMPNVIISGSGATAQYNTPPDVVIPPQLDSIGPGQYIDTVQAGDTVNLPFAASDFEALPPPNPPNTPQTLTFTATGNMFGTGFTNPNAGCPYPPCATLSPAPPFSNIITGGLNFQWITSCNHLPKQIGCVRLSSAYNFVVKVYDNFCPTPAVNFITITIVVLAPPEMNAAILRCASVLHPSGNVQLTWDPPADTGVVDTNKYFKAFYIYRSFGGGPFSLIDSVLNINIGTYTDLTVNANSGSYSYYIESKSGCDLNVRPKSNIINTIYLQVAQVGTNASLTWNPLSTPLPAGSTGKYYIYRESPPGSGTFSLIDSTNNLSYLDPVNVCNDSINYYVSTTNTLVPNCSSQSNINGATLQSPVPVIKSPSLRCTSVLNNGDVVLSWKASIDTASHFSSYNVYQATALAGPYTQIGTVTNYGLNTFTHVGANANSVINYYYVTTKAGCDAATAFECLTPSDTLESILLTATPTLGFANLSWNALRTPSLLPSSTGNYKIYRRIPPAVAFSYVASTTSLTYQDVVVLCNSPIFYRVDIDDNLPCTSNSSVATNTFTSLGAILNNPELRCLSVQANGDVQLSWQAPADPNNFFAGYQVYQATSAAGPFTLLTTVNTYATTTYTHVGANANTTIQYYYLKTLSGCTGIATNGSTGDTLKTMLLSVSNATLGAANLSWNAMRTPSLGTSPAPYKIFRRTTGVGAYTQIGTTAALTYSDPITTCNVPYEYHIELYDSLPCTSVSSAANSVFTYLGNVIPNPDLHCVSVLPNGNISLTWTLPAGSLTNFNKYIIWRDNGSGFVRYDSISNSATTTYTDVTANGNTQSYSYYMSTESGCTGFVNSPANSNTLSSIFLTVSNTTLGFANLSWTAMHSPMLASAPGPYIIKRRTTGSGAYTQIGTSATLTYQDVITTCNVPYEYTIELADNAPCVSTSNAANSTFTYIGNVIPNPDLHCVNVLANGNISLTWTIPAGSLTNFNKYIIWRDNGSGFARYDSISNSATTVYTDVTANGNTQSYSYYMSTESGCTGFVNSPANSNTLSSIYLTVSNTTLGFANLSWTAMHSPMLASAPGPYIIKRRTTGSGAYTQIGTSATLTYQDVITTCNVPYEYTIELADNSPCISTSNAANGIFTYIGNVIGNPILRCASVMNNGNIQLSWENPSPASFNDFNEYEVWSSNGGAFTRKDSVKNNVTNTFTDLTANGNSQPYSYYLITHSGCTGQADNGSTSDTLSSIFLTATPALGLANLSWTPLRVPLLPTSVGGKYNAFSSYNAGGILTKFGDTTQLAYSQNIVNCDTTLNHMVTVDDQLGCTSKSNVVTNVFTYLGNVIDNPDLRCVSVLPNGNIQLTWIAPTGSSVNYNEYEIYRNNGSGWALYDSVKSFNQTTYTDLNANGNNQSYVYYLRTLSGCTGRVSNGGTSDTLHSIYVITTSTLGLATLNWTAIRNPIPVTASTGQYDIWSSYNAGGNLAVIGDTAQLTYFQNIVNCDTTLRYQVSINDNSGCVSQSNVDTNLYTYIGHIVDNPDLRCVQVLANGNIQLTWVTPASTNINFNEFEVYRNNGSGWALYDSIKNFNQTTYTDLTANGNSQSYGYYLRSMSGCSGQVDNGSTSAKLNSIYVTTVPSLGLSTINWIGIQNPIPATASTGQYDIWSSYNASGNLAIIGDTAQLTYFQNIMNCDTTLHYQVTLSDNSGCVSQSNVNTNLFTYIGNVINNPELRCANVLPNGNVQLSWQNPAPASWINFNQYNLWRNNGAGYTLIDSVEVNTTSSYTDLTSNGYNAAVSYYLITKSGCTGQVDMGFAGDTISSMYLKVTGGNTTQATLNWNPVHTPNLASSTGNYIVERQQPAVTGTWTVVANQTATSYTEPLILCIDSVNYRVSIADNLACTSVSNIDGETFVDHTIPEAPTLHCASVTPTGDVMVTWSLPVDTGMRFNSYQLYTSNSINGPFSLVNTIFSYNTNSYFDVGANAQSQNVFYYMTMRTDCGREYSINSDTIETMKVKVLNNNGVAVITWNPLHNPELSSGTFQYDVYKEYPAGIWNIIGTTTAPTYQWFDTINVCSAVINYKVETDDVIGCTSTSSTDGQLFKDVTKPTVSLMDTVSLDPNAPSNVSISWLPSPSGDVLGYIVYHFNGASWDSIGAVVGINNNFFQTVTPAAANAPQLYSVAAYDSCLNVSNIGTAHNTLHITAKLDVCRSAIDVRWNPYLNMVGGIGQYNVYVSDNGGPVTFLASVPGNNISYSHVTLQNKHTYCYYIQAQGNVPSRTSTSNTACETANLLTLPTFSYLKKATVIDLRRVEVECYVDTLNNPNVSRYKLQRSFDAVGPFTTVGVINYTQIPIITFYDFTARTDEYSYYYRVITVDSCGNEVLTTNLGRTILLTGQPEYNLTNILKWNDYSDWSGGVRNYALYREVDGVWEVAPVTSTPNLSLDFTDDVSGLYRNTGKFCYRVESYEGPGNIYGFADTSVSNEFCMIQEPHLFLPNAFTPGGKNPILRPEHIYMDFANYFFVVYNRWGQKVFETRDPNSGWDGTYQGTVAPEGSYVYNIRIFGTNGQEIEKNGSVTILR